MDDFAVVCASGSYLGSLGDERSVTHFDHRWTAGGVEVAAPFTGAHLLHAAVAGCVLNDLYREAQRLGIQLDGARVRSTGGFDQEWASTGIRYAVEVDSPADPTAIEQLLRIVDEVAEIPRAIRAGAGVQRLP